MKIELENPTLHFLLDRDLGTWDLQSSQAPLLSLEGVRMLATFRRGRTTCQALGDLSRAETSAPETLPSPHGPLRQVQLALPPDNAGIHFCLTFALPETQPLFLWKLSITNNGREPIFPEKLELLRVEKISALDRQPADLAFFSNGWGSLNYTGVYGQRDRFRRSRFGFLFNPMRVNAGTPQPKSPGHFASDFFGVLGDRASRQAVVAGFLSQLQHFGSLEARLQPSGPVLHLWANGDRTRLDPGQRIETDWACLQFLEIDSPDPLAPYLKAVARQHGLDEQSLKRAVTPVGWCSWYHYFDKITAGDIQENLKTASGLSPDLPIQTIQIDDGFETRVGDWFSIKAAFPDGLAPLASQIREAGFTPGLWLAPFIVTLNSHLAREHPDWLIRGRFNLPANGGFSSIFWRSFTSGLDLTNPAALNYAQEVIDAAVNRWGFSYLKLDFLYAAALPGRRHDPTRTRAQVLRAGLEALRQVAGPQTFLLGSISPLGPGIGLLDSMRVGSDVDVRWRPAILGIESLVRKEPDFPSARNAIQNDLTRACLHRIWWLNDPDCLLLRPDTQLAMAEIQTLASVIALSGGPVFYSDKLADLPHERLRIAQFLSPPIGQRPRILDWFDSPTPTRARLDLENACGNWSLLALFNWQDTPQDLILSLADFDMPVQGAYHGRDVWRGVIHNFDTGAFTCQDVPPHGTVLMAVRTLHPGQAQYLGSDLHVSQGLEVAEWQPSERGVSLRLTRPGRGQGSVDLALPGLPRQTILNKQPISWEVVGTQAYRFAVAFDREANLEISLSLD